MKRLEEGKAAMMTSLAKWPEELLEVRPKEDSWCALEVLDHVVRVESGITGAVAKGMTEPHPIGVRDRLGFLMVERIFLSRYRVKVPNAVEVVRPGPSLEMDEIVARWELARGSLAQVAEEAARVGVRGGVFRHPVSGWMSFDQVLRFFSVHMVHHEYQLERIRESLRAPI